MDWESSVNIDALPAEQIARGKLMCSAGSSAPGSSRTWGVRWELELGWGLHQEGVDVYIELSHFVVQQKLTGTAL